MNNSNPIIMYDIQHMMNDYFVIYHNKLMKTAITPDLTVNTHTNSLKFIDSTIKDHKKVVVFTHHPATLQSLNKLHAGNNLDPAYASDYEKWVNERPQIKAWISGHTHMKMNIQVDNCRYVSNSKGYYHEKSSKIFKPNTIIEI